MSKGLGERPRGKSKGGGGVHVVWLAAAGLLRQGGLWRMAGGGGGLRRRHPAVWPSGRPQEVEYFDRSMSVANMVPTLSSSDTPNPTMPETDGRDGNSRTMQECDSAIMMASDIREFASRPGSSNSAVEGKMMAGKRKQHPPYHHQLSRHARIISLPGAVRPDPNGGLTTPVPAPAPEPNIFSSCFGSNCVKVVDDIAHTIFSPVHLPGFHLPSKEVHAAYANPQDKNSQVKIVFTTNYLAVNLDNVANIVKILCTDSTVMIKMKDSSSVHGFTSSVTAGHAILINGHWGCGSTDATWRTVVKGTPNGNVITLETSPMQPMSTFAADYQLHVVNAAGAPVHTFSKTKNINLRIPSKVTQNPLLVYTENNLLAHLPPKVEAVRAEVPSISCTDCSLTGKITFSLNVSVVSWSQWWCALEVLGLERELGSSSTDSIFSSTLIPSPLHLLPINITQARGKSGAEKPYISAAISGNLDGNFDVAITTPAMTKHLAGVTVPILTLPLSSFGIPGILSVGELCDPALEIRGFKCLSLQITHISTSSPDTLILQAPPSTINTGFDFTMPEFSANITGYAGLQVPHAHHTGSKPTFRTHKPSMTGSVSLSASASLSPKLKLGVSILGVGGINAGMGINNAITAIAKASVNDKTCSLPSVLVDLRATSQISAFVSFLTPVKIASLLDRPLIANNTCVSIPGFRSGSSGAAGASLHGSRHVTMGSLKHAPSHHI
ncbi:hypothetical protein BDK51DRAFT_40475 [Blyttiomyces helicus]|uniref:DUF7223 domain-containing protein n=1 Tax=Blyttiomyces helicus TaxID=388810 RepID=A0A4P9WA03_9FUNG|nr:hypothetical protein BDK51DRAFT_40475 [Blyttiomyces helicus]|eukprot:RKO89244.1 hypothetical protein BDK51DRAFT_40475 [Blyttiomyces helicus]